MRRKSSFRCACALVALIGLATTISAPAAMAAEQGASSFTNGSCFFIVDVPQGGGYGGTGTVTETPDGRILATCHAEFLFGNYVREPARAYGVAVTFYSYSSELVGPCAVQVSPSGRATAHCSAVVPGS
ncbi:MAG: hypothetical protein PVJ49_21210 [Acidobacteriota bacterium]|jgi:hypothetical protein